MADFDDDLAPVWRALADPTRRRILDRLRGRAMTTGEIAAGFEMSRIAVMKHLAVLADSGLVIAERRGRERWHNLNHFPLRRIYERWFEPGAGRWAAALSRLKDHVEGGEAAMTDEPAMKLAIDIAQSVDIAADRSRVRGILFPAHADVCINVR